MATRYSDHHTADILWGYSKNLTVLRAWREALWLHFKYPMAGMNSHEGCRLSICLIAVIMIVPLQLWFQLHAIMGLPRWSNGKESTHQPGDARDADLIPGLGRDGDGNLLHCSCLENSMDRRAWWVTVHGVTKSRTWLSDWTHTENNYAEGKKPDQKSIHTVWFHF